MVGVAASQATTGAIVTAGIAGLAAGAMAMAAGEYVSVSSQSDVERADRAKENAELAASPAGEQAALASASSFTTGGLAPFLGMLAPAGASQLVTIVAVTVVGLAVAGMLGARAAGTAPLRPT